MGTPVVTSKLTPGNSGNGGWSSTSGPRLKRWQVPDYGEASPAEVVKWCREQKDDGVEYLRASPGFEDLEQSIRLLSGDPDEKLATKQKDGKYSKATPNRIKRNLREMVNSLADVRFTPGFRSEANEWQKTSGMLNKTANSWYADRFIDIKIKQGVQWMAICKNGWLEIDYRKLFGERGKSEIDVEARSAMDVVMTGVPESGDFQEAYTVTIIKDLPPYQAHSLWPEDQSDLVPDRETPKGWFERIRDKASSVVSSVFDSQPVQPTAKNPTCRIYYTYVLDQAINRSGKTIKMGYEKVRKVNQTTGQEELVEVKMPWSYDVPSVGGPIKAGYDKNSVATFKYADAKQCRLFPGRRLIVWAETATKKPLYDGPTFSWHGKVPLVKLCGDSWPFADFSMVHDAAPLEEGMRELIRIGHQTARNRFNPSILYNYRAIDRTKAKAIRTDMSGQRIGFNGNEATKPVESLLPEGFYKLEDWFQWLVKWMSDEEDYQMGVRDISAMAKMRVGASSDSMEKLMELAGPIVKGISRDMERSLRDFAEMFKYLVFQYYTSAKLMSIVGEDGMTPESFDFDPGNLVPSHLPGEDTKRPSIHSDMDRAHFIADKVKFFITPNTMHEIVQTSQKMIYLQLWSKGFPIDPWTLAEIFHIANFGPRPKDTDTIWERYMAWQKLQLRFKAVMSVEARALMQELFGDEGDGGGGGGGGDGGGNTPKTGPAGGAKGTGGRASANETTPKLTEKDGGSRSTLVTSQSSK